jgi:uncharacterized protein DUF1707
MFERTQRPSADARVSDIDRQRAAARLEQLAAEGVIRGDEELKLRLRKTRLAISRAQLDIAFEGLEAKDPKLKGGDLRASNADRRDAIRRLEAHNSLGHLSDDECSARVALVRASKTPNEIAKVFTDLPELAANSASSERRISIRERDEAIDLLEDARLNGQLDEDEHAAAKAQVLAARTRGEIDVAFHGISTPSRAAAVRTASHATKQTVEVTSHVVVEGGRRLGKAFLRGLLSIGMLMIGLILLIAGIGIAALICFVASVLLFVGAGAALVTSQRSA